MDLELEYDSFVRKRKPESKHDCFGDEVSVPQLADSFFHENLKQLTEELDSVFEVCAHETKITEKQTRLSYIFTNNEQATIARRTIQKYDSNYIAEAELSRNLFTVQLSTKVLSSAKGWKKLEKNMSFYILVVCLLLFLFVCVRF